MDMKDADQLALLEAKFKTALDWGREELDLSFLGIVGVLESIKFELLCEMHNIDEEDEDEEEDSY